MANGEAMTYERKPWEWRVSWITPTTLSPTCLEIPPSEQWRGPPSNMRSFQCLGAVGCLRVLMRQHKLEPGCASCIMLGAAYSNPSGTAIFFNLEDG